MSDNRTKISITGKVAYSDEISIAQAAKIISFLNSEDAETPSTGFGIDPPAQEQLPPASAAISKNVNNPRDALDISGAKTNPEKIVALGAYVLQDGGDTFKVEDVKSQFRRARETPPANFTRDLNSAVGMGWIFEAEDARGEYYLNSKIAPIFDGDFVFPKGAGGNGGRTRGSKKAPGKAKAKASKPETLADIDEFRSTFDGYPGYSKMKSEKDRLLWVVNYMREKHDRNGLTNKEIAWVTGHIGTGIPSANIAGAFRAAKTPGYATRSTLDETIKITDDGVAYLRSLGAEASANDQP